MSISYNCQMNYIVTRAEPLWMRLGPSWKRLQSPPFPLQSCEDTLRKRQLATQKRPSAKSQIFWHPGLGLPTSRTLKSKFLLSVNHTVYSTLQSKWTKSLGIQLNSWTQRNEAMLEHILRRISVTIVDRNSSPHVCLEKLPSLVT